MKLTTFIGIIEMPVCLLLVGAFVWVASYAHEHRDIAAIYSSEQRLSLERLNEKVVGESNIHDQQYRGIAYKTQAEKNKAISDVFMAGRD